MKIVNEWGQKLHRCCRKDFGPMTVQMFFLKIDTEGDKTKCEGGLFQKFAIRKKEGTACTRLVTIRILN